MILIVAHHYVVNSGLLQVLKESNDLVNSSAMLIFGAWGKTGINCFVLITGYFMCKSSLSGKKLLKLYFQIAFYGIIFYVIFCITGRDTFSPVKLLWTIWPIKSISWDFVSCFIIFYMFIPILNVLVNAMDHNLHKYLIILIVTVFSLLPSFPKISMTHNYVTWFMALYLIAAYIRTYGIFPNITHKQWGLMTLISIVVGSLTVVFIEFCFKIGVIGSNEPYFFIADSNKFLSLMIAICSFMFFKGLNIPYSRFINIIGASTFGVLLIHANSDLMRQWLWHDIIDCTGHFGNSMFWNLGYATIYVLAIFIICVAIDWLRLKYIEPQLLDIIYNRSKKMFNRLQTSKEIGQ